MRVLIEIFVILLLIVLNGYFSLSEIALLSVKKSRLRQLEKNGNKKAGAALLLVRKSPEMLAVIQIGITSIGIFAGAFGGSTIAKHLATHLDGYAIFSGYGEAVGVALTVIVITYLSLIIGELVPKQLALSNPEKFSLQVFKPITTIMRIMNPIVKVLASSTLFILRILKIKPISEQVISEEEIKLLIAEGAESGVFEKTEQRMVERIFHLGNRPIQEFMTPAAEVVWLDINDTSIIIKQKITGSDRSVFPVCDGSLSNVLGAVETKDVLTHIINHGSDAISLKNLIQPVMHMNDDTPSLVAIERLKHSAISIALITKKGSSKTTGIVSFHDILEAIVGEFKSG